MRVFLLLKKVGYVIAGLMLSVAVVAGLGSYLSLDREYSHTKETASLPLFSVDGGQSGDRLFRVQANGFEFRARIAGIGVGRSTVILLHGFPATSAMWISLIPALAEAGYQVIAFDQRGYSPGARPNDPTQYQLGYLVDDVLAIADAAGADRFHLVGHDWGAAVGWTTVLDHPGRILSWTGLSIAHPVSFSEALATDPDQQSRSRYFNLFTTPLVPELLLTFNDLALLTAAYEGMNPEAIEEYRAVFAEPRALSSALNWYRQMGDLSDRIAGPPNTVVPTLFIWGNNDAAVGRTAVLNQNQYMKGPYREVELEAEHWLMTSHADSIIPEVLEHIGSFD